MEEAQYGIFERLEEVKNLPAGDLVLSQQTLSSGLAFLASS